MSSLSQATLGSRMRAALFTVAVAIVGMSIGLLGYIGYANASTQDSLAPNAKPATSWAATDGPWAQIQQFHARMDQLFANAFHRVGIANDSLGYTVPNMDLRDAKDHYEIVMDMPGTDKSTIKVNVNGDLLSVSGQRSTSGETKQGNQVVRQERSSDQFERVVSLPGPVNATGLKSNYVDGVLTITVPKSEGKNVAASATSAQRPETSPSAISPGKTAPEVNATPFATENTWNQIEQFHNSMDQLFADTFSQSELNGLAENNRNFTVPMMDLQNLKDHYEVRMDMPGTDKQTVKVNVEGRFLSVSGQRNATGEDKSAKPIRSERSVTDFERTISLPGPVRINSVAAKYDNGVLTIDLPKADQVASAAQIPVH